MRIRGEGELEHMITGDGDSSTRASPGGEERLPLSGHLGEVIVAQRYASSNIPIYLRDHSIA